MISIKYKDKKEDMEKIYTEWFRKNCLNQLKEILINDTYSKDLRDIIFFNSKMNSKDNEIKEYLENIDHLGDEIKECLEKDIISFFLMNPEEHFKLIDKFGAQKFGTYKGKNKKKHNSKIVNFFLNKYDSFRSDVAFEIIKKLEIKTCPYCNISYIDTLYKKGKKKFIGQLDHYFDKDSYPYLGISLYNLIPSCQSCNHIKGTLKDEFFHPYTSNHKNLYLFKTEFDNNDVDIEYLYGKSEKFKVSVKISDLSQNEDAVRFAKSKEKLLLEERYNSRKIEVKEIIKKVHIYNELFLDELENELFTLEKDEHNMHKEKEAIFTKEEMKRIIFNNDFDEDKHLDRSMSKLTYDILKEFGVE